MPNIAPETKFMSQVTAQSMHEMQNILAIIHESAGLLGDILTANAKVNFKHRPKMESTLQHIFTQVHRGKSLLHAISRLAHASDDDLLENCDLAVQALIGVQLSERMVRLCGCKINLQKPKQSMPVRTGALLVLMAIHHSLLWAISNACSDQNIEVDLMTIDSDHVLRVHAPVETRPDPSTLDCMRSLLGPNRVHTQECTLSLYFPALT